MTRITPEELGRLYREHAPALRLYVRQWPNGDEDLVQDAFIKLAQQAPAPEHVLPWLYRVVRNGALAAERGNARRRRREDRASAAEAWFTATDDRMDGRQATRLLTDLPLEQREVVVARIWGGLTFEEVACLVGCSLPTAHRRYQAGLSALQEETGRPMDTHSNQQDDLSDLERRLSGWRPEVEGLSDQAVLFAAGIAAGRAGRSRIIWPGLCGLLAVLAAGLGAWGFNERAERQFLISQLPERAPVTSSTPASTDIYPSESSTPAPDGYFNLRRQMEQDPGRWLASNEAVGTQAPRFPPAGPAILSAGTLLNH